MPRQSNRQELADLFDREFDAVYRFCLARTGDTTLADDAAADAFTAAARLFASGRGEQVDRPWLFVVARNRVVDNWRSSERHQRRFERLAQQRLLGQQGDDPLAASPVVDLVLGALSSLSDRQRSALTLRYLDEQSVAEVAEQLDLTYRATESLLARARRSFATAWENQHVG